MIGFVVELMGPAMFGALTVFALFGLLFAVTTEFRRRYDRTSADERAERLLQSKLTPDEYGQLLIQGYMKIPSPSRADRYYLVPRQRGFVRVYDAGRQVMRLCVGPKEWVPDADVVLMHKLMIEGDETEYLRTAIVW